MLELRDPLERAFEAARRFVDRYALVSGLTWPASLLDHYIAYRALVRAKIACARVAQGLEEENQPELELAAATPSQQEKLRGTEDFN